eukprot:gene36399-49030_t
MIPLFHLPIEFLVRERVALPPSTIIGPIQSRPNPSLAGRARAAHSCHGPTFAVILLAAHPRLAECDRTCPLVWTSATLLPSPAGPGIFSVIPIWRLRQLMSALALYKARFKPSAQLEKPCAMVAVNVIAADYDSEARHLATTQQVSFTNMFRGTRGLSAPPIDDIETYWSPVEKAQAMQMLSRSIIGSPLTVKVGLEKLIAETGADELIVVSDIYDHDKRLSSFEIIADTCGILIHENQQNPGRYNFA